MRRQKRQHQTNGSHLFRRILVLSRLAAAFNHGFINKSLREVFDVTRMILSAKEELANEPYPIDGLSGEYAEKSLEEWEEQIRKGADK